MTSTTSVDRTVQISNEPSHIQINPLLGDKWGWVVWWSFGDGDDERDCEGVEDTLAQALAEVAKRVQVYQ